ncbi:hypothetical protein BANRA_05098 [Klebsiella pneumoniae]|nr:hypothetical protein BANRA_05098 [Klebsiella pneumoniae]
MNLTKVGSITTSDDVADGCPTRSVEKADELGGKYFVVIAGQKTKTVHANADVYK